MQLETGQSSIESEKAWKKQNRAFVTRLDVYFLTWAYLSYLCKQIDSSNYKTAYVNGMKEDLGLYGNELNYFNTFYRIGYSVFIPISEAVLASSIIRVSYWIPGLELIWGIATALIAVANDAKTIYGLRFLIGLCEASSYAGLMSLIVYWYKSKELAKRLSIFGTSYPLANIFTSSLQIAINEGMDGVQGLEGWRWLFIWNGIITVIIAISGFFLIPDALQSSHAIWMTNNMREIAEERFTRTGYRKPIKLTFQQFFILIRKGVTSWITYAFTLTYAFWSWSQDANTWFTLFLKSVTNSDGSKRFTNNQLTSIPIGGYVLQIVFMMLWAYLSDKQQRRCRYIVIQQLTIFVGTIILSTWPASFGLKMFAYFFLYLSNCGGPLIIAWMSDLIGKQNTELRTIYIGLAVTLVNAIDSFQNIFFYPASEAPNYRIGYKAGAARNRPAFELSQSAAYLDKHHQSFDKLSRGQIYGSLAFLVGVPYLRAKGKELYDIWGGNEPSELFRDETRQTQQEHSFKTLFKKVYPYANLALESALLSYNVRYMFNSTPFYRPWLAWMNVDIRRQTMSDLLHIQKSTKQTSLIRRLASLLLSSLKTALPVTLFILKFLQWWYSNQSPRLQREEEKKANKTRIPPPGKLSKHPESTIDDEHIKFGIDPLTGSPLENPTLVPTGYVYSFKSIFEYVDKHSCCPVTLKPVKITQLRKIML
ncbi:hypothetical protein E3P86_02129 [Wallemia ichthyophaga]|uniref:Pex N-terminal domain-containing protein n=1 Tax=Wallemia ichthyophaga TaxID=245174 RepID=A0A4T0J4J2_WALIC|nr:hypothetical protein E3P86_02129 [Wallemia ichthyophaga]